MSASCSLGDSGGRANLQSRERLLSEEVRKAPQAAAMARGLVVMSLKEEVEGARL